MTHSFDDAVVGAGILGLAHAYHLARAGRRVVVFERSPRACGASVRNFGMIWPIGQPAGQMHAMARRSREHWLRVLEASQIWHESVGSLHLAYHDDEAQVLSEFATGPAADEFGCQLLTSAEVLARSTAVQPKGLRAGLWSPHEICVDPRQVIADLPGWLTRELGVTFVFNTAVTAYEQPVVIAGGERWEAQRLLVCAGDDFQTLYPTVFASAGMLRCKLQMMRTSCSPDGWRLGPMLAAGSTLRHYKNFQDCPSLPSVKARYTREYPQFDRYGIHVMASQNGRGELVLGDSHEYDAEIQPFDKPAIDRWILEYLDTFLRTPEIRIEQRWHGIYAKHPSGAYWIAPCAPGATAITGMGGAGMTLSFGLAEHVLQQLEQ